MQSFIKQLDQIIDKHSLLKHPFYQLWNSGGLNKEIIKDYAAQYYHHVKAFPRYISATHSMCDDLQSRKILVENLNDEEYNCTDHPTLWQNFAIGVGNTKEDLSNSKTDKSISDLISEFFKHCRSSYARGLAALYTYEAQIPEIAETKLNGLKNFYNVTDKKRLEFFEVHQKADIWHREQCKQLLAKFTNLADQQEALKASESIAIKLWNFLSSMMEKHNIECHAT